MNSRGPFFGLDEAARYCSISRRTLSRRIREIRHYRLGNRILIRAEDLDKWLSKHLIIPPPSRKVVDIDRIVGELQRGRR